MGGSEWSALIGEQKPGNVYLSSSEARAVGLPTCSLKRSTEGGAWCWLALSSRLSGLVASSSEEGLEREEAGL